MVRRVIAVAVAIIALSCFTLPTPTAAQQAATPAPARADAQPVGYHMVLLVADDKPGAAAPEGMTPAVTKALKDAQQFLPFKSYRPLDSAIVRGVSGGSNRVQGMDGRAYSSQIIAGRSWPMVEVYLREDFGEKRTILRTEFRMAAGETVVAGTSRLAGGEALVVILTALAETPGR